MTIGAKVRSRIPTKNCRKLIVHHFEYIQYIAVETAETWLEQIAPVYLEVLALAKVPTQA